MLGKPRNERSLESRARCGQDCRHALSAFPRNGLKRTKQAMIAFLEKWFVGRGEAQASVILRRQVPIRFDEPARSWLGGLPQMPDQVAWPRTDRNGAPLHFIAQIACADLPDRIWKGRGPRGGWLLLFADVLQMEDTGDGGLVKVLHVDQLGSERGPPEDMPTVRHALSDRVGSVKPMVREGVPKLWRRWPVDLVEQVVPVPPARGSEAEWEPLPVSSADLYDAPADNGPLGRFDGIDPRPITWRGALYLVEGIARNIAEKEFDGLLAAPSSDAGWLAAKLDKAEKDLAAYEAKIAEAEAKVRDAPADMPLQNGGWWLNQQREAAEVERDNIANLSAFSQSGEEALAAEIERAGAAHLKWLAAQSGILEGVRRHILAKDGEALLGTDDWLALKAELTASPTEYWNKWIFARRKVRRDLLDYHGGWLKIAMREDVLDLYTRDAVARSSIPPAIRADIEPKLRHVGNDRLLHRMGGPRDALQGYASPTDDELLFQISSDEALGWMWGDVGALFVYLSPAGLKARRFKKVDAWIDGH